MTPALKEVVNRLQKLSYREMETLASKLRANLDGASTIQDHAQALLDTADEIEQEGEKAKEAIPGGLRRQ